MPKKASVAESPVARADGSRSTDEPEEAPDLKERLRQLFVQQEEDGNHLGRLSRDVENLSEQVAETNQGPAGGGQSVITKQVWANQGFFELYGFSRQIHGFSPYSERRI